MAITATFAKLNETELANTVRTQALEMLETAQTKLAQAQETGRTELSKRVLISAEYANQFSQFLADLSTKIAPPAPAKRKVTARKTTAKPKTAARRRAA